MNTILAIAALVVVVHFAKQIPADAIVPILVVMVAIAIYVWIAHILSDFVDMVLKRD